MNDQSPGALPSSAREAKPWKAIALAILLLAIVVAVLWFWRASRSGGPDYQPHGPVDVVATVVAAEAAPVRLQALGNLRAVREVILSAEVAGRISAIAFEPGQRVKAGTVLVQLDDAVERADLASAKASAAFAQQQFERARELSETGAQSREVLQQRQSERDQAQARIDQLEARIQQKSMRASFAGELGLRQVNLGQYLNPGDAAVTLTDLESLYVNFDVPQQELARVRTGQPVEVRSDTPDAKPLQAKIIAIEPQVGRDTRNATVQARLTNAQRTLRPGMYVTVAVSLPDELGALLVPASAIVTSSSGDAAVVVRGEAVAQSGKAAIVPVQVGRRIGDRVIVTNGLKDGDVVVTEGQLRIQPGADVRVVPKSAQSGPGTAPVVGSAPASEQLPAVGGAASSAKE